jgi:hypothetical protein
MRCPVCQQEVQEDHVHGNVRYHVEHTVTEQGRPVEQLVMSEWRWVDGGGRWEQQVILESKPLSGGL